jgi:Holliday junction resolvase
MKKVNLKQKEKAVEAYLVRHVKALGGKAYKFTSPGNNAVPDRIVVVKNVSPIFVELKAEGGKLSKLQRNEIDLLLELGQNACVCVGKSGVDELIAELKKAVEIENEQ